MNRISKLKLALTISLLTSGGAFAQNLVPPPNDGDPTVVRTQDNQENQQDSQQLSEEDFEANTSINASDEAAMSQSESSQLDSTSSEPDRISDSSAAAEVSGIEDKSSGAATEMEAAEMETESDQLTSTSGQSEAEVAQSGNENSASTQDSREHMVHFEFDSAELTQEAKDKLQSAVEQMKDSDQNLSVTVAGHTDATGPESYNKDLAERRADAVKQFLKESELEVSNIDVRAIGEEQPISSNETPSGREENRRVEISPAGSEAAETSEESSELSATNAE